MLGTLEEVDRPALAAVVPSVKGRTLLIDVGANANCKARQLEEFAVMADVYASAVLHIERPRIGLMSMGEEETKGTELTKEVHEVLKGSELNFIGNVEGRDLFNGKVDVVVMDGFTGNVVLKACESLAESLFLLLREELSRTGFRRTWAWLSRHAFRGRVKGERRSPRKGISVEFSDYRPYGIGDDLRYVDWNIYGRLDRLYVKLFVDEALTAELSRET